MTAVLAVVLVVAVVNWLLAHWWILIALGTLALLADGGRLHHKQQQARWEAVRTQSLRYGLGVSHPPSPWQRWHPRPSGA